MPSILKSLKLLSDPTRMRILHLLEQEPLSVAELQEILGMGQSRISTQLSSLKAEGLVSDRRSGKHNFYSSELPEALQHIALESAAEIPDIIRDRSTLDHILKKRRDKSRAYFDELAGKFGKNYVPGRSWKSLAEAMLKVLNYRVVADLGAGEGTLSQLLAQRAEQVIAIDNSPKMVEFGTALAAEHGLANLEYRLGDISDPPIADQSVDLAIFSQALHHAENPSRALAEAYRILRPGGCLIILDLLQHSYEAARDLYHDVWLGFSEVDLAQYLTKNGFEDIDTTIVDKEPDAPYFQTLLATARRPGSALLTQ